MSLQIKRIYEPPSPFDGDRILVDRLWPRGVSKKGARLDSWLKDVAPTPELREWFDHRPDRWEEFEKRYRAELVHNPAFADLCRFVAGHSVTLLYGAKDNKHNHALVLADAIAATLKTSILHP
ncbi:DUF488 family protein [Rhizobium sp. Root1220]|uniref:DUF488 domain-containing protein n=1 Tax=Rhizobium sp. Root1220 TaxID=1736432 RepID=UPI0006F2E80B|nr:DUF488 family protein [Rhizobium sp. Root1220]KQV83665.1 hypothetical protein ASC90_19880 [Rhizobium sp. Root1220]